MTNLTSVINKTPFKLPPALAGGNQIILKKGFSQNIVFWLKPFILS
jgi:hypothetical protein